MATSSKARYLAHGAFYAELRRRVEIHFATIGCAPNKAPGMYAKTAVMLGWFAASYVLLVFWAATYWQASALAVSLGLATAGIGFNVQHDGVHGGYSPRKGVNRLMALSLDMLGGSSYVWSWKHNVFHHSNPNAVGLDADIDIQPLSFAKILSQRLDDGPAACEPGRAISLVLCWARCVRRSEPALTWRCGSNSS